MALTDSDTYHLKTVLQAYIKDFNDTDLWDCNGFPDLKCDPRIEHCPYSIFGEVECVPCKTTCNTERLTNEDVIFECLKQCPGEHDSNIYIIIMVLIMCD